MTVPMMHTALLVQHIMFVLLALLSIVATTFVGLTHPTDTHGEPPKPRRRAIDAACTWGRWRIDEW